MRLRTIRIRNLGPFRDFSADLTTLPEEAKIVAVTGPNGAGKSTLLELWSGGALFRECSTRGSLASLATSRDASLEVVLDNGQPWTIRHTVDSVSGKGESVVMDALGVPATDSGKVREYDAWAAAHLPRPELLYSSQIMVQGSGGFLDLKPGDRKAVVLRLLGVERLEPMAKRARERARELGVEVSTLRGRIADAEAQADTVSALKVLEAAQAHEVEIASHVAQAQLVLDVAKQLAGDSALAMQRYQEQVANLEDLKQHHAVVEKELSEVNRRIANNRSVLARADQIRAAVKEREEANFTAIDGESLSWKTKSDTSLREVESLRRESQRIVGQLADLAARIKSLRAAIAMEPQILLAVEELPEARRLAGVERANVERLEYDLAGLRSERLSGAEERIVELRDALGEIQGPLHNGLEEASNIAREAISDDDAMVERSKQLPVDLSLAESELKEAHQSLTRTEERFAALDRRAAMADRLKDDNRALVATSAQIVALETRQGEIATEITSLVAHSDECQRLQRASMARSRELRDHLTALVPLLELEKPLENAEALLAEREEQRVRLSSELSELTQRIADYPAPVAPEASPDVERLGRVLDSHKHNYSAAVAAIGSAQAALDSANAAASRASELGAKLEVASQEQSDWTLLGEDLGRDGLQAALVDGACSEITVMTNDLLHSCVGSRWTVTLDTQRASADGKRQLEGFTVRVLDNESGRDTTAETLSGGERVLVSEAISLALTALACRKAGVERPTLIRDESGAALDAAKAHAYVAMLRRAAQQIGADRVLFVSHSRDVQDLADARIEVGS